MILIYMFLAFALSLTSVESANLLLGAGPTSPRPFTPASIPGLVIWLNGQAAASINSGSPANGDPVSIWKDQSGNGNDFTQPTALLQPSYTSSGINSKPVISFSGVKVLYNTTHLIGTGATPFTIFAICTFDFVTSTFPTLAVFTSGGYPNDLGLLFSNNATYSQLYFGAASPGTFGSQRAAAFGGAGSYAMSITYDGGGAGAAHYASYSSNVSKTVTTTTDNPNATSPAGTNTLGNYETFPFPITNIGEFYIYDSVLNSTNLGKLQVYNNAQWGL